VTFVESPEARAARLWQARVAAAEATDPKYDRGRSWNDRIFTERLTRCGAHQNPNCYECERKDESETTLGAMASRGGSGVHRLAEPAQLRIDDGGLPRVAWPRRREADRRGEQLPQRPQRIARGGQPNDRFRAKLAEQEGCLVWTSYIDPAGYGRFSSRRDGKSGWTYAHRWAWEQEHGPLEPGEWVRQTCENRACVRHLEKVAPERVRRAPRPKYVRKGKAKA
jgi:HNH endonuclease